ncbi:hypothetical protein [Acetobacter sp. KSO5]|uniref:hypothetical protein n=1 Tax=Acetobacter sp. KSO5 TaxID=3373674 RepID=UPI00376EE78A
MIKHLALLAFMAAPSLAFGQAVQMRPNHTLPQYSAVTAANSNTGASRSMLRMAVPSVAGGYAALWPPGGLRKDTRVPSLYADGSSGTLEQIGRMADGSVQQTDVGATVAPLDTHKMMSAPVSGDSSASPVLAASTTTPRTQADRAADSPSVKDFGARLDGSSSDQTAISSAFSNNKSNTIRISSGAWPGQTWRPPVTGNTKFVDVPGYLLNPPNTSVTDYGINQGAMNFGNGVTSVTHGGQYFPNSILYSRVSTGDMDTSFEPMISYKQILGGKSSNPQGNETIDIATITLPSSTGYATAQFNKMFSMGMNYYGGFDVNHWSRTQVYGTNWAWDNLQEYAVVVPYDCPPSASADTTFCSEYIMNEMDYTGTIIEDDRTAYAPSHRRGTILGLGTGHLIAKTGVGVTWEAGKTYHRYQMIITYDARNKPYMFRALPKGYTVLQPNGDSVSGSTQPRWTFGNGDKIEDGTVEWTCLGPYHLDIGAVISIMGGNDPANGWIERVGTYLTANTDYIYNAAIDMSEAQWDPGNEVHVFSRQQADVYDDFTADGTAAGQNNHLLGYDSSQKALTYKVNGVPVLSVKDSGAIISSAPPQMPVMTRAQIRAYPSPAKGMEIYDSDDDTLVIYTAAGWKLMPLSALPAN